MTIDHAAWGRKDGQLMTTVPDQQGRSQVRRGWRRTQQRLWLPAEDALVVRHAGHLPPVEIARLLNVERAAWGVPPRSLSAVKTRANRTLGVYVSLHGPLSLKSLALFLGARRQAVLRVQAHGWLQPLPGAGTGRGAVRWWAVAEVERFLREAPWAYDPARLGAGRLGDLGRLVHLTDPWLVHMDVVRYLGLRHYDVRRLRERGILPSKQRLLGRGHPHVYRRSDVVAYARNALRRGA